MYILKFLIPYRKYLEEMSELCKNKSMLYSLQNRRYYNSETILLITLERNLHERCKSINCMTYLAINVTWRCIGVKMHSVVSKRMILETGLLILLYSDFSLQYIVSMVTIAGVVGVIRYYLAKRVLSHKA